jgi:lambda family phage portal protein
MTGHGCRIKRQFYQFERQADGSFGAAGGSGLGVYGNSYQGAAVNRRETNTWNPAITDADSATIPDLPRLRARSRDAIRNQPMAGGAIGTTVTNVVGSGLVAQPTIDHQYLGMSTEEAEAWQAHTEREFALWAESKNASLNKSLNFYGLQELAFRSTLENGDVFANTPRKKVAGWPYRLRLQLIEADRVCNPNFAFNTDRLVEGVEKDEDGAPVAYNVLRQHPGNWLYVTGRSWDWQRLDASNPDTGFPNVIHLYKVLRADQTRGIPMLAPVIEPLKMLNRYQEHVLMAAAVSALFTVFVKSQGAQGIQHMNPALGSAVVTQQYPVAEATGNDLRLGSGNVLELMPGEEVEFADPKQPGNQFDPFFLAIVRQIGVALEIPFEILIKHYTASYSAARAAMLDAWKFFLSRRKWLADNFCQPIYEIWLAEAVALGRVNAPGFFADPMIRKAYCGAIWNGPGRGMINEKEESLAMEKRIELGVTTAEEETRAYNGTSWAAKQQTRVKEKKMRDESGLPMPGAQPRENIPAPPEEPDGGAPVKEAA